MLALLLAASASSSASRLDQARQLEREGKPLEASILAQATIAELRQSGDAAELARALSQSSRIEVSLGKYQEAIRAANEAIALRKKLKGESESDDYNTLGLANLNLSNYPEAIENYRKALAIDRKNHDVEAEVIRLNNIGNVHYFLGQYQDAYAAYQEAMDEVNASYAQPGGAMSRQLTTANLAALYQRLGLEQEALGLYRELTAAPSALSHLEYAQLLLNKGVLYRRLGDPIKALAEYSAAQPVFAAERNPAGEIGALRNIGIVRVMDLRDFEGAGASFTRVLDLARRSSDARGIVQALLYRGEAERRMGLVKEAKQDLETALAGATKARMVEEQWKSQFGLGQLAQAEDDDGAAEACYRKAMEQIESMRAEIRRTNLRNDFLADKRDPYDAILELSLQRSERSLDAIFSLMERSRARSLEEKMPQGAAREFSLRQAQAALPDEAVLVEYWMGAQDSAALWFSRTRAGLVRIGPDAGLSASLAAFTQAVQSSGDEWKVQSGRLGKRLLSGIPASAHYLIVPDRALTMIPFEALIHPATGRLVIENAAVTYLPAARFLRRGIERERSWRPPWETQLIAYGNPPVTGGSLPGGQERWEALPAAADEMNSIGRELPGKAEIHQGAAARKQDLLSRSFRNVSLLHLATHAAVDTENPDRSRILLASDKGRAEFLYQREIYGLKIGGVDLVTLSACETAEGPVVAGDGARAFSQAFLAAGASATVASLWRVADRPTAELMKQFYYFLGQGEPKAYALRAAKLRMLETNSQLAHPRYWSAFLLYGDGWNACARYFPWSWILGAAGVAALAAGLLARHRLRAAKDESLLPQRELQRQSHSRP